MARRYASVEWELPETNGKLTDWQKVEIAVLMDIRDELKMLNRLLHCSNFTGMPAQLRTISRHVARIPKKPRE